MTNLEKLNFALKVTTVRRNSLDKLIQLADSEIENSHRRFASSLKEEDANLDVDALHSILDAPKIAFSLYSLAIIHCYSTVEKNRKLICSKIPGLTSNQIKELFKIDVTTKCLATIGIVHENIRCYKTMDEFRSVNNAIKHDSYSLSTFITTNAGKRYCAQELRSLYSNRAKYLETYLSDLYERVRKCAPSADLHKIPKIRILRTSQ